MAQIQGPPPTITNVQSANTSLIVTWAMSAYSDLTTYDATLLVIDTTSNSVRSILLNTDEIFDLEYTIDGLINGNRYAILFSILNKDGITVNSNTATGIPSDIPSDPYIEDYTLNPPLYETVDVEVTLGPNTGLPATSLVFRICREDGTPVVTTQAFQLAPTTTTATYTLVNFAVGGDYIISCQALNVVGYGNVSNSRDFINGDVADRPVLGIIQSGSNNFALLPVSGDNTSTNEITSFKVYNNDSSFNEIPITPTIAPGASYSLDLSLNTVNNETGYSLSVSAITNYLDESLKSNVQTVVPALKLAFSNAAITFPASNQIRVDFSNNNASWVNDSRVVTLDFSGNNVDASATIINPSLYTYTYTLPGTSTLVPGSEYTVTIGGYCSVPTALYDEYWTSPILTNYKYEANELDASGTYYAAPNPVTNISVTTDITIDGSGIIQPSWTSGGDNGSTIINYTCNLYTVDVSGNRTFLERITTTATTCTFENLQVIGILYSVGIIATNSIGSSTEEYYPEPPQTGFTISATVPAVTNLKGYQTSYNGTDFSGNLTWNYNTGPGTGNTNAVFHIYSVVNDASYIPIGTVNYNLGQPTYSFAVSLGRTPNVSSEFAVNVVANSSTGTKSSAYVDVIVTPSLAPVISDVSLNELFDASRNWLLTFTVTNNTNVNMVQNGILSLVMPNPVDAIADIDPIYSGYDAGLVDTSPTRSYRYERDLGYQAISNDYILITAVNLHGETVYKARWGGINP
jgi:hypothetical protein